MVIGQFNDSFPPMIDGVANVVINYCRILNESFGKCHMITLRNPKTDGEYPFEVLTFKSYAAPFRNEYRWGFGLLDNEFWSRLSNIPLDIVHAHSPFSTGSVAKQIAKVKGIPLVATLHSKYREDFLRIIKNDKLVDNFVIKNIAKFYNNADDVWTVNESTIKTLREYGYLGDVFVMNNGTDMPVTVRDPVIRASIINKFELKADLPVFAYVGQVIQQKNIALIINALDILNKQGIDYNMLIIGEGPDRQEFENRVKKLGLCRKIHFTGRIYDRDLLRNIYASCDAVLFPSLYDSSSLVLKEAAACSCPTVLVAGSTTSQGIHDGRNGFLAKNNPADYALKIKHIISTEGLSDKVGINACNTLYISWIDIVKQVFERYMYVIDRKKVETSYTVRHIAASNRFLI